MYKNKETLMTKHYRKFIDAVMKAYPTLTSESIYVYILSTIADEHLDIFWSWLKEMDVFEMKGKDNEQPTVG